MGIFGPNKKELAMIEADLLEKNKDKIAYVKERLGDDIIAIYAETDYKMEIPSNDNEYHIRITTTSDSEYTMFRNYHKLDWFYDIFKTNDADHNRIDSMNKLGYNFLGTHKNDGWEIFSFLSPTGLKEEWRRHEIDAFVN